MEICNGGKKTEKGARTTIELGGGREQRNKDLESSKNEEIGTQGGTVYQNTFGKYGLKKWGGKTSEENYQKKKGLRIKGVPDDQNNSEKEELRKSSVCFTRKSSTT